MDNADRFERIASLFELARELPPHERESFLRRTCGEDTALIDEVESLLKQHDATNNALDQPAAGPGFFDHILESYAPHKKIPKRIDHYKILGVLGRGGMGVVYRARQDNPSRDVAVKVIRSGDWQRELLKRFELEAAVLGRLQHPGIAQIYEAGLYGEENDRCPYLAMEFVAGQPLDEYVSKTKPLIRERLKLFLQICDAVHHAHQKGVIHRDLKPANILVVTGEPSQSPPSGSSTNRSSSPVVKILDFGVARATDADLQVSTLHTNVGQLIGTLPYMSPEQINGLSLEVDTRSDVYALGVILYQLLAGRLPFELHDQSMVAAARVISEEPPTPLTSINGTYRGDLNTITLKALEKNPERRYDSSSDLAADVQRYLDHQPIDARPATVAYQLSKFAARNKGLVAGIVAAIAMLVLGTIASSMFAFGQMRARRESERHRSIAQAVNDFLNDDLLAKASPYISGEKEPTVRAMLDKAAASMEERFGEQPEVAATLHRTIGKSYFGLGHHDEALHHMRRAKALCEQIFPEGDERSIKARGLLTESLIQAWKLDEAEAMASENIRLAEQYLGERHPWTARTHGHFAVLLKRRGRFADAEKHYRRAIELTEMHGESTARFRLVFSGNLALVLRDQGKYEEGEAVLRDVVAGWTELMGRRHPDTAFGLANLGDNLWHQAKQLDNDDASAREKLKEAESLFREALDIRRDVLGEEHPHTAISMYALGLIHSTKGEFVEAERLQRETLALRRRIYGTDENVYVLDSINSIATALRKQQRYEEAAVLSREALDTAERAFGVEHYSSRLYRKGLLSSLWRLGKTSDLEELVSQYEESLPEDDQARVVARLAWAHAENDNLESAIEIQQKAIHLLPKDAALRDEYQANITNWQAALDGKAKESDAEQN